MKQYFKFYRLLPDQASFTTKPSNNIAAIFKIDNNCVTFRQIGSTEGWLMGVEPGNYESFLSYIKQCIKVKEAEEITEEEAFALLL